MRRDYQQSPDPEDTALLAIAIAVVSLIVAIAAIVLAMLNGAKS